jgi:hypothetical protein
MARAKTGNPSPTAPQRPASPRPGTSSRKATITVPRTSKQKRKGDKPPFRTDMDFIDET